MTRPYHSQNHVKILPVICYAYHLAGATGCVELFSQFAMMASQVWCGSEFEMLGTGISRPCGSQPHPPSRNACVSFHLDQNHRKQHHNSTTMHPVYAFAINRRYDALHDIVKHLRSPSSRRVSMFQYLIFKRLRSCRSLLLCKIYSICAMLEPVAS